MRPEASSIGRRCSRPARRSSSKKSSRSAKLIPSAPKPRYPPRSWMSRTRAIPASVPLANERAVRREHLVGRPRVADRRLPHLRGEVRRQAAEELLVVLMDVDVLVARNHSEGDTQTDVLVRSEGRLRAEMRQ